LVRAVVLVKSPLAATAAQVKRVKGVKVAFDVMGRFDCVALVDVEDMPALKKAVFKIQKTRGVSRTETMVEPS
jgi:DNA-binding Lrp family transcriptional regulator